ncbi:MAG TPA: LEA type 2 family protein [Bacteroidales bacterium]|nr:LEA type 2 family protein [Bacteroidales bacterium]
MKKVLYLLILAALTVSCKFQSLEISRFDNFQIVEFKDNVLTLKADVVVNNPNPMRLKIIDADFDLKINDKIVGHLSQMDKLVLAANTQKQYPITAKFELTSLQNGLMSLIQIVNRRGSHVSVTGSVTGKSFLYRKSFDFSDIKIYE